MAADTTTSTAYTRLANGMTGLVALMSASTPIGASKSIGASDMCMGVARDNGAGGALDSKPLTLDCSGVSTAAAAAASGHRRRVLLTAASGSASVTMGAGFSSACSADSTCRSGSTVVSQTYVADPTTALDQVAAWPDPSLVTNASNSTQLSAISGGSKGLVHIMLACVFGRALHGSWACRESECVKWHLCCMFVSIAISGMQMLSGMMRCGHIHGSCGMNVQLLRYGLLLLRRSQLWAG